jgi:GNAT superfamily N-acetyltransferase
MSSLPIRRLARLRWADRALLVEALATLTLASLAIRLLPFRSLMRAASAIGPANGGASFDPRVRRSVWAVQAWARRVPWRAVCFQRGLAVHVMLRRRGIGSVLHYGVSQADGLKAHVWVRAAGHDVIGCEEAAGFTCLATWPPVPA